MTHVCHSGDSYASVHLHSSIELQRYLLFKFSRKIAQYKWYAHVLYTTCTQY